MSTAGLAANLRPEAHLRKLVEQGFQAALVNFRFLAHAIWTTEQALVKLGVVRVPA